MGSVTVCSRFSFPPWGLFRGVEGFFSDEAGLLGFDLDDGCAKMGDRLQKENQNEQALRNVLSTESGRIEYVLPDNTEVVREQQRFTDDGARSSTPSSTLQQVCPQISRAPGEADHLGRRAQQRTGKLTSREPAGPLTRSEACCLDLQKLRTRLTYRILRAYTCACGRSRGLGAVRRL